MIAETGLYALILAMIVAGLQGFVPLVAGRHFPDFGAGFAARAAYLQAALLALSFACLVAVFVRGDFSVALAAAHSHSAKPLLFKIAGVWGNHEGSMLLWVSILAGLGAAFAGLDRSSHILRARGLAILGGLGAGFLLYILLASSPFARLDPVPLDGEGLNPLLQDVGLAFHPPLLYFGYVGAALPFALAVAGLIEGKMGADWARAVRPWALMVWTMLTLGIGIGAWWSYYTLGWGGYWAWDPVENAALLPWLSATALIHGLSVMARRDVLKLSTVFAALIGFALSLFGTFLVRSGAVASVHAFASDPSRGVSILVLMVATIGGALILFAARAGRLARDRPFALVSREGGIMFNNALLALAAGTVLVAMLLPLAFDVLGLGRIVIGESYYNRVFAGLCLPLTLAMALGPLLAWRRGDGREALKRLRLAALAGAGTGAALAVMTGAFGFAPLLAGLAAFVMLAAFRAKTSWAMRLAHLGLAVMIGGIAGGAALHQEKQANLRPGEHLEIAGRTVRLIRIAERRGPNYQALRADILVSRDGQSVALMHPEIRLFDAPKLAKAEVAIRTDLITDLHLAISADAGDEAIGVRAMVNPLTPLVFIGMALMTLGGLWALLRGAAAPLMSDENRPPPVGRRRLLPWLPLAGLGVVCLVLAARLAEGEPPVPLSNAPAPALRLPALTQGGTDIRLEDYRGRVVVVNLFASWCAPCRAEAPMLMKLSQAGVPILGIAYKDRPETARAMLRELGDPFLAAAIDEDGRGGAALGVTGVPETLVIDRQGAIRWRHAGALDHMTVDGVLLPLIRSLP